MLHSILHRIGRDFVVYLKKQCGIVFGRFTCPERCEIRIILRLISTYGICCRWDLSDTHSKNDDGKIESQNRHLTLWEKRWPTLPKSMTNRFAILIGWLSIQSEVVLSCSVEIRLILWERVWHKCSFKFKFNPLFTVWSKSLSLNINLSSFESKIGLKPRQRKSDFSILRARIEHLTSESNQRTFVRTFRNLFKMLKEVTVSIYN